jgi:hypothetical protein
VTRRPGQHWHGASHRPAKREFSCEARFGQHEDGIEFSQRDLASEIVDPDGITFAAMIALPMPGSIRRPTEDAGRLPQRTTIR